MEIGVEKAVETAAQQAGGLEHQLEAGDEVHVEGVEVGELRSQLGPRPRRHAAAQLLAAPLGGIVSEGDTVVGVGDFDKTGAGGRVPEGLQKGVGLRGEVAADLHQGHDAPVVGQGRVEGRQRIGDPAPLFGRGLGGVAAVDRIPDHRAQDPDALHTRPHVRWMNTAAAP